MKRITSSVWVSAALLAILGLGSASTATVHAQSDPAWHLNYSWKHLHLRTEAQRDAGLKGGEGMRLIVDIAYAQSNPDILYLVSDTAQVWKSTNGGFFWEPKHDGFLANAGVSIGIDPENEDVVFVAGSKHMETHSDPDADGIYRTLDGGNPGSWC